MRNLITRGSLYPLGRTANALYLLTVKFMLSLLLVVSGFLFPLVSFAQTLIVRPLQPKPGDTLHIEYDPRGGKFEKDTLKQATAVVYEGLMAQNKKINLIRQGKTYSGELLTDSATQFVVFAFSSKKTWDNPTKEGHFFPFYRDGKPVEGALYLMADWWVNEDAKILFDYRPDFKKATELLKQELRLYPVGKNITSTTRNYYENYYKWDPVKGKVAILEYIQKINKQPKISDVTYYVLNRLYEAIGMVKEAENALNELIRNYPNSPVIFAKRFKDAITPQAASQMEIEGLKLIKDYNMVEGTNLYSFAASVNYAISEAYIKESNVPKYFHYLLKASSSVSRAASLIEGARLLTDQQKESAAAEKMGLWAFNLLDTLANNKVNDQLSKRLKELKTDCIGILGKLYYQQKKFDEAYSILEMNDENSSNPSGQLSLYYGLVLVKYKKYERANTLLRAALRTGVTDDEIIQAYQEAYTHTHTDDFNNHIKLLLEEAAGNQSKALKKLMINEQAPEFRLVDNLGNRVSLSDYKGKIVILDFWATWCIPCLQAFPGMQQAINKYKNDKGIVFLFINTGETFTKDRTKNINNYLKENKFDFQVILDEKSGATANKYQLQALYGATSIPLKVVIDRSGNIRFRSVGYPGSDELVVSELSRYIEILKGM